MSAKETVHSIDLIQDTPILFRLARGNHVVRKEKFQPPNGFQIRFHPLTTTKTHLNIYYYYI